jgi:hypothetical protein
MLLTKLARKAQPKPQTWWTAAATTAGQRDGLARDMVDRQALAIWTEPKRRKGRR